MYQCFTAGCTFLHKTVILVVFFFLNNEKTYQKGRALMQMYRVVPQLKRENGHSNTFTQFNPVLFL